jgi:predicted nucleic acid-binding protein
MMSHERVFIDTNIFLRYLTNDVPAQAEAIGVYFRRAIDGEIELLTNHLVVAEIVWTLESYYHISRQEIYERVMVILNTPGLVVEEAEIAMQAVVWYLEKNVDYIDAYHAAWLENRNVTQIYTLDRKHFSRFEGLTILPLPG